MPYTRSFTLHEATRKLEHYCAYQDRCHQDVLKKLREMRMIPEAIDHIMGHLITHDFLNEERFAKSYARGKFRIKNWGRIRISIELKRRDISPVNIKIALKELDEPEYSQVLEALAKKRLAQLKDLDPAVKKKKLSNYLEYRGWERSRIFDLVEDLIP